MLFDVFVNDHNRPTEGFWEYSEGVSETDIKAYCGLINRLALGLMLAGTVADGPTQDSPPHRFAFLYAIKRIVDGCVDGDRLDYTIRDIRETGTEHIGYDLDRVIRYSTLLSSDHLNSRTRNSKKIPGGLFSFGFFHRAVPGIEQFFEARYQCYKYLIFHRASLRSNACMEQLLCLIFICAYEDPNGEIARILHRYGYVSLSGPEKDLQIDGLLPLVTRFIERIEDSTLRSMLYEIREATKGLTKNSAGYSLTTPETIFFELSYLLEVLLFRNFAYIATPFKDWTVNDILDKADNEEPKSRLSRARFVRVILANPKEYIEDLREILLDRCHKAKRPPIFLNYIITKPKCIDVDGNEFLFEDGVWIEDRFGRVSGVFDHSPSLRGMRLREPKELSVKLYALSPQMKSTKGDLELVETTVLDFLRRKWPEQGNGDIHVPS
jgi:hypothetical protein